MYVISQARPIKDTCYWDVTHCSLIGIKRLAASWSGSDRGSAQAHYAVNNTIPVTNIDLKEDTPTLFVCLCN
jgi:hypothetical protein